MVNNRRGKETKRLGRVALKSHKSPPKNSSMAALIVTYNSNVETLAKVLDRLSSQVCHIIIIDNGSSNIDAIKSILKHKKHVKLIETNKNTGMTGGLNIGIKEARKILVNWVITLDQATIIPPNGVREIMDDYDKLPEEYKKTVGVLGFKLEDLEHQQTPSFLEKLVADAQEKRCVIKKINDAFTEKASVITTGNIIKMGVFDNVRYDEGFYMDHMDTKFGIDVREQGYHILEYNKISLQFIVGRQVKFNGKVRGYEPKERLYYITRNSTYMFLHYNYSPLLYLFQHANFYRTFFYYHGIKCLPILFRVWLTGTYDGILGRLGKCKHQFILAGTFAIANR